MSKWDRRLRYGGPWFRAASGLPIDGDMIRRGRLFKLFAAALQRPPRVMALIVLFLRTSSVSVSLSNSPPGRALGAYFRDRSCGLFPRNRFCRGVLVLPRDHDLYLRGRRRQALRTNLRNAATARISYELITDPSRGLECVLDVVGRRDGLLTAAEITDWRELVGQPELTLFVARDAKRDPVAVAGVVADDMVALIRFAAATNHEARWGLHDYLVRTLITSGVSYLVAEGGGPFGALGFEPNVQHYQRLLGYELCHLTLGTPRPVSHKLRILARVVMLTSLAVTSLLLLAKHATEFAGLLSPP